MPTPSFLNKLRALVVDDDPFISEIVVSALRDAGLSLIETVGDGKSALENLLRHPVELLVCDLNMPGMDGIHLMSQLATFTLPPAIILLSGEDLRILDASRRFAEAKHLTVLGVLRKPLTHDSLMEVLHRYQPMLRRLKHGSLKLRLDEASLLHGLSTGALQLLHQPKIDLRDGSLAGVESLLRWNDAWIGAVPPQEVIRAAEDAQVVDALTQEILTKAVQDRAVLLSHGIDIHVSINVSMHNLVNARIVDYMSDIVRAFGDFPSRYTLEVTENHLIKDLAQVLETLIRARLRGFQIAIDDYGTGAATMQLLMQLPSTELKIDKIFVSMASRHDLGRSMLQSAIELGLQLDQIVTAEGVETAMQDRIARELGCHLGQGHYYGRPMTLDALIAWNETRRNQGLASYNLQGARHGSE